MKNLKSAVLPLACVIALAVSACSHKKVVNPEDIQITKNGLVSIDADWVKDRGIKFDTQLKVTNISSNDIIILLNDLKCYKGETQGNVKQISGDGERTADIRKGQLRAIKISCNLGEKIKGGEDRIVFGRIFDNPGADGSTRGKVLGENIEWKYVSKN